MKLSLEKYNIKYKKYQYKETMFCFRSTMDEDLTEALLIIAFKFPKIIISVIISFRHKVLRTKRFQTSKEKYVM